MHVKWLLIFSLLFCTIAVASEGHHSGITGQVLVVHCPVSGPFGCLPHPYSGGFAIYNEKNRLIEHVVAETDGSFVANLKPGEYLLVPDSPPLPALYPVAAPQKVTVNFKEYTLVVIVFDAGI